MLFSVIMSVIIDHDSQLCLSFRGNQQLLQSRQSLEQCLTDISSWMLANGLKLNRESID